jgi:Amt family ammonium transporter
VDRRNFWLNSVTFESYHPLAPHVPEVAFILYQLAFAILTPAIICGSFADRMRLLPMLAFMTLWHLLVTKELLASRKVLAY